MSDKRRLLVTVETRFLAIFKENIVKEFEMSSLFRDHQQNHVFGEGDYENCSVSAGSAQIAHVSVKKVTQQKQCNLKLMDHLTTLLTSTESSLEDLHKRERICRENVDQLSEGQWQLQLAQLRLQKEQIEASTKLVQQQLGPVQKRLNRTRRARKLRRKNRLLHKRLVKLADDEHNKRAQLAHEQQVDEEKARREQLECEQFDREDATSMLNEISRKKKDLLSFHQKVISLEKYRSIANQTESGSKPSKNPDAFTLLKENIINRLVQFNKEETYIKEVFNVSTCTSKKKTVNQKEQQQTTLQKQLKKHSDQWHCTLVRKILPDHSPESSPEFGSCIPVEWYKYVSSSTCFDHPNMNKNNIPTPSTSLSFWKKYSLS